MSNYKLDIFETLASIDKRDFGFYDRLTEEQRKGFAPPVILKWVSGIQGDGNTAEQYIWLTNQANINFWDIYDHPELQYKLMASAGRGRNQRHKWIPLPKNGMKSDKVTKFLSQFWPDANDTEMKIILNQYTRETFIAFVYSAGLTPEEEKEIIDAYDRYAGKPKKAKKSESKK